MKTVEEKAKERVSWNDVKEKYLKFHRMDMFTENMAIDIDFGYWLANEVINEALRWIDPKEELPNEGEEVQLKIFDAYHNKQEYTHDVYLGNRWRFCESKYIEVLGWRPIN